MNNHEKPVLSSEQALDDYFTALLGEDEYLTDNSVDLFSSEHLTAEPEPEPEPEPLRYVNLKIKDIEVPELGDVQRLLNQMETTNVVADSGVEALIEQNTVDIVAQTVHEADEIQGWDPEVLDTTEFLESTETLDTTTLKPILDPTARTVSLDSVELAETPDVSFNAGLVEPVVETEVALQTQSKDDLIASWGSTKRSEDFQVLYFDVNGVTFAVPLDELGGIYNLEDLNHLIGRPEWYLGLQNTRDQKLDVVDTAKWVMADKLQNDSYKDNYNYIVMLDNSPWGLASNKLLGTELLNINHVRWREQQGKRPWLAGMVKEKMCALINVQALIGMLNIGLDVKSLNEYGVDNDINED